MENVMDIIQLVLQSISYIIVIRVSTYVNGRFLSDSMPGPDYFATLPAYARAFPNLFHAVAIIMANNADFRIIRYH